MKKKKYTLDDIARLAGVSRSTASRAINERPDVSQEVRARVLGVVEQTSFKPNAAARSLASQRTSMIGMVLSRKVQGVFEEPYFAHLIEGTVQACNQHEYNLTLYVGDDSESLLHRISSQGFVDGVVVAADRKDNSLIVALANSKIPMVIVGRPPEGMKTSYIDFDNRQGAYLAVIFLMQLGFQRIGTIAGPSESHHGSDRLAGYQQALIERGVPVDPNLVVEGDLTEIGGYRVAQRLLEEKPEAIMIASDRMAIGAMQAIRERGLKVPEDVAVVSFDDLLPPSIGGLRYTTIRQPVKQMGIRAVETLLDILEYGPEPTRRILFDPELVVRDSCGSLHRGD